MKASGPSSSSPWILRPLRARRYPLCLESILMDIMTTALDCHYRMYNSTTQNKEGHRAKWHVSTMLVSIASQEMTLRLHDQAAPLPKFEHTITDLGYQPTQQGDDEDRVPDL